MKQELIIIQPQRQHYLQTQYLHHVHKSEHPDISNISLKRKRLETIN